MYRLTDYAKSTLQLLGADISDVQFRGSFGFIAQKGFPAKTVLRKVLTEAESLSNPAQFNAKITGIQRAVKARRLRCIFDTRQLGPSTLVSKNAPEFTGRELGP